MQYQAILFDLDGTLLDTAPDLVAALNRVLHSLGEPIADPTAMRNFASHGAKGLLQQGLGDKFEQYDFSQLRQNFLRSYAENICDATCLFPGTDRLLDQIRAAQIPWGIVTNKPGHLTDAIVPQFQSFHDCQVVISGDTLPVAKPHPDPLLHACSVMGVEPHSTLYVGDAERDIQAGIAAGMLTAVAMWGYLATHDRPATWQADHLVDRPDRLLLHTRRSE